MEYISHTQGLPSGVEQAGAPPTGATSTSGGGGRFSLRSLSKRLRGGDNSYEGRLEVASRELQEAEETVRTTQKELELVCSVTTEMYIYTQWNDKYIATVEPLYKDTLKWGLLLRSCPSLQRCCWIMMLLSLHPNIIVRVENVVSLVSSPSTSSQKVRKCVGHKFLSHAIECGQLSLLHCLTEYLCEFLPLLLRSCPVCRDAAENYVAFNIIVHV